jgi:hypothetical protein
MLGVNQMSSETNNNNAETSTDVKRKRLCVLSDNKQENVSKFACARLNKAANSVRVFGQCFGSKYDWKTEQIDKAEEELICAVESAIENLRTGKKIAAAGITL